MSDSKNSAQKLSESNFDKLLTNLTELAKGGEPRVIDLSQDLRRMQKKLQPGAFSGKSVKIK